MTAAHERRLRPEQQWEVIGYPGGTYVARRVPTAELLLDLTPTPHTVGAVIVVETHDLGLAADTAWTLWTSHQRGPLSAPTRHWWRRMPTEIITGYRLQDYDCVWSPARPGSPGAQPVTEFPFPAPTTRVPTPPWLTTTTTTATTVSARGTRDARGDRR